MSLSAGTIVGRYKILAPLGSGGMGQVYRAWDTRLDRPVAVKVLPPELTNDADRVRRFVQEAKAASALNHPYIISVFDIGQHPIDEACNVHYMAMEFVEGETLREKIATAHLTDLLRWLSQIGEALQNAHEHGIIHRDLKPENIMVTKDGHGKLLDFGLAKLIEPVAPVEADAKTAERLLRTNSGVLVGTIPYMSPEQIDGIGVDARSDIFAFGSILYEVVTKQRAFRAKSPHDTLYKIVHEDPTPIQQLAPDCPASIITLVELCLRKRPADRPQSMRDVTRWLTATLSPAQFHSRDKRQALFLLRAVSIAGLSLLLFGSALAWDHLRIKISYYANVGTRFGVPEGVGSLDEKMRCGRVIHFQVESRRRKVRRILRLNSADQLTDGDDSSAIQNVSYREDGTVQQIDLRDHNERLVMRQAFSELHQSDDGYVQYVDLHAEHQEEPLALDSRTGILGNISLSNDWRTSSEITSQQLVYDSNGRSTKVTYLNVYRQVRPNKDGIYGQRYTYPRASLLPNRIESLGADGIPSQGWNGVLQEQIARNTLGDLTEKRFFGSENQPVVTRGGCHRESFVRDVYGNPITFACWGVDDEPRLYGQTYHKITRAFDSLGNEINASYFGTDGKPTLDGDGVHRVEKRFDGRGNVTEFYYFGIDGKPTLLSGFHKATQAVDSRGNVTAWSYFGIDGRRTLCRGRFHSVRYRFDDRGNVTEVAFFGIDGQPTTNMEGAHMIKSRFDARDHLVRQAFFDINAKPTLLKDGFHLISSQFDSRGNVTEEAFFGIEGKAVLRTDGYHRVSRTFDLGGNLRRESFFGVDGKPTLYRGFHSLNLTFDVGRRRLEQTIFGIDGQATLGDAGFYKETDLLDSRGNVIEESFFGIDGKAVLHTDGYHKRTYIVDESGNRTERRSYDVDGKPTADYEGIHLVKTRYDNHGYGIEEAAFGVDGQPTVDEAGIHKKAFSFDSRGNVTEVAFFGLDGKPWYPKDGVQKVTRRFDDLGNMAEESLFERNRTTTKTSTSLKASLDSLASALRAQVGTEVRFTQRLTQKGFSSTQIESGTVVFGTPPKMRWTYQQPEAKQFVFNGSTSWFYIEEDRTVTVVHMSEKERAASPFAFLFDSAWVKACYQILETHHGSTMTTRLRANTANAAIPSVTITQDGSDNLIHKVEYLDQNGNLVIFEFASPRKVLVPDSLFEFTTPKGVTALTVAK